MFPTVRILQTRATHLTVTSTPRNITISVHTKGTPEVPYDQGGQIARNPGGRGVEDYRLQDISQLNKIMGLAGIYNSSPVSPVAHPGVVVSLSQFAQTAGTIDSKAYGRRMSMPNYRLSAKSAGGFFEIITTSAENICRAMMDHRVRRKLEPALVILGHHAAVLLENIVEKTAEV